ncbi:hypothetical protein EXIGLDRAFT_834175 [Exidia glandulosa HHB12029]|uniref:Uncharacterized protein n=1 Tax=Exidia glandulosa HHB12029 TaxID=1314781 RepID=A0A165K2H4_EXIGL|nr:hypothetical protein EXIGLDRAFT_834175 [Exidia glandulosa HHB12029]
MVASLASISRSSAASCSYSSSFSCGPCGASPRCMSRFPRLSRARARTRDGPGGGARHQTVARVRTRVSSLSLVSHGLSRYVGFSLSFPSRRRSRPDTSRMSSLASYPASASRFRFHMTRTAPLVASHGSPRLF